MARGFGRTVNIQIDDASRTTTIEFRLKTARESGGPYDRRGEIYGLEAYTPRDFGIINKGRVRQEIYTADEAGRLIAFITCYVEGSVPSPNCEYEFVFRNLLLTVGFNKSLLPQWHSIERSVKDLLERFTRHALLGDHLNSNA